LTPNPDTQPAKKKKKKVKKILSYDDEEETTDSITKDQRSKTVSSLTDDEPATPIRKVKPNPNSRVPAVKAVTKAAQLAEAEERDRLRRNFLETQEKVKATEIAVPFVFYDGANIPGDTVKVKKGDHIWLLLEKARKVAAEKGVQGSGNAAGGLSSKNRDSSKKEWARIGVDDLMLVKGEIIIPHHYEIYYFIVNQTGDPTRPGKLLFNYTDTAPKAKETPLLRVPGKEKLEGHDDDPSLTKVVDRRWYQKNKHIFPASTWKEFKAGKEFEEEAKQRKDAEGNAFFFA
jgi:protein FAM50